MQKETKQLIIICIMIIILGISLYLQNNISNIENEIIIIENDTILVVEDTAESIEYIEGVEVEVVPRGTPQSVIDTAMKYKNIIDFDGKKSEANIQRFLKSTGLSGNQPYCQAYVYYCFSNNNITEFKTALANGYYTSLKNKYGSSRGKVANTYGLICWKYPNSSSGHIGFILRKTIGNRVKTLEGNTSGEAIYKGKKGVFEKQRLVGDLGGMKLRGVVQI